MEKFLERTRSVRDSMYLSLANVFVVHANNDEDYPSNFWQLCPSAFGKPADNTMKAVPLFFLSHVKIVLLLKLQSKRLEKEKHYFVCVYICVVFC